MYMSTLSPEDLVYYEKDGKIMSGGYAIESLLMKGKIAPMSTANTHTQKGGSVSSIFKNMAVPAGLLLLQQEVKNKQYDYKNNEHVEDDLHDKLLDLISPEEKKTFSIKTRRNKPKIKQRKTRKHK